MREVCLAAPPRVESTTNADEQGSSSRAADSNQLDLTISQMPLQVVCVVVDGAMAELVVTGLN